MNTFYELPDLADLAQQLSHGPARHILRQCNCQGRSYARERRGMQRRRTQRAVRRSPQPKQRRATDVVSSVRLGAGPFLDLSDPMAPRLVGTLPRSLSYDQLDERSPRLLQLAGMTLRQLADAGSPNHPSDTSAVERELPAQLDGDAARQHAMQGNTPQLPAPAPLPSPPQQSPQQSPAPPLEADGSCGSCAPIFRQRQYRTREENLREISLLEISRLSLDAAPEGGPPPPTACYEERRDWLGRVERWYTAEEVARHRMAGDLWLVVRGKVYDASEFVETHPGGAAALLKRGGGDATKDFDFHSARAQKLWEAAPLLGRMDTGITHGWGLTSLLSWS